MIKEKAAGSMSQSGLVVDDVAINSYQARSGTAIEIDGGSYAIAKISGRFQIPPATAFEVCRMAGLGVR